jgi:hypothetical protein
VGNLIVSATKLCEGVTVKRAVLNQFALVFFAAAGLGAAAAQGVPSALRACAAESDNGQRLACYDREMAKALAAGTGPAAAASTAAQLSPEERFGMRGELAREVQQRAKEGNPDLERVETKVTSIALRAGGEQLVTIENGQVWEERTAGTLRVKVGESVTIRSGALGSFFMTGPSGRAARVTRIR